VKKFVAFIVWGFIVFLGGELKAQVKYFYPSDSTIINTESDFHVSSVTLLGHKQTKDNVIWREITFREGDTLSIAKLEEALEDSYRNLKNTSLFNFTHIECHYTMDNKVVVLFNFEERWYIWPFPVIDYSDRNLSTFLMNKRWDRLNYGMYLRIENFRGRNELIKIKAIGGYKKQLELSYFTPNLDKKQRLGLESYLTYLMWDNVEHSTFNNQLVSFKDTASFAIIRKEMESTTSLIYRKNYNDRHKLAFTYKNIIVDDTITALNPNFLGKNNTEINYFRLIYNYYMDKRDYKYYPLDGYYWDFFLVDEYVNEYQFNNFYIQSSLQYYGKIHDRIYWSSGIKGRLSTAKTLPFYLNRGIGYNDFLRGFEEYVTNAPNFFVNKNNLKFQLVRPRVANLKFLPYKKFNKIPLALYVNLFVDSGYSYYESTPATNTMNNSLLFSYGLSMDLVTYYDKVISVGYSYTNFNFGYLFVHYEASGILSKN